MLASLPIDLMTNTLLPFLLVNQQMQLSSVCRSLKHANNAALYQKAKRFFPGVITGDCHDPVTQCTIRWMIAELTAGLPEYITFMDAMHYYAPSATKLQSWKGDRPGAPRSYNRRDVIKESIKRHGNIAALRQYRKKRDGKNKTSRLKRWRKADQFEGFQWRSDEATIKYNLSYETTMRRNRNHPVLSEYGRMMCGGSNRSERALSAFYPAPRMQTVDRAIDGASMLN